MLNKFETAGDRRTVVYSPPESERLFRDEIAQAWGLAPQADGDLGNRMRDFFESNAEANVKNILIGSDTPNLPVSVVDTVAGWLGECDVVLGPSADGGYYLIAMTNPVSGLFEDIQWSTEEVLASTIAKLDAAGCSYKLLPEMKDVDEFSDLELLMTNLRAADEAEDKPLLEELLQLEMQL